MTAIRRLPGSARTYSAAVTGFLKWCEQAGTAPELSKTNVQAFLAALLACGAESATARARFVGLTRLSARGSSHEDEIAENPLAGMKQPKVDSKVVEALTDDELRLLIKTCQGQEHPRPPRRGHVRLMLETGARAGRDHRDADFPISTFLTGWSPSGAARAARAG